MISIIIIGFIIFILLSVSGGTIDAVVDNIPESIENNPGVLVEKETQNGTGGIIDTGAGAAFTPVNGTTEEGTIEPVPEEPVSVFSPVLKPHRFYET